MYEEKPERPVFSFCFFHVAYVFVYDLVESAVVDCSHNATVTCVWPDAVRETIYSLEAIGGGIIGLVGLGLGKSNALLEISGKLLPMQWPG
jgi:hypothetical protein